MLASGAGASWFWSADDGSHLRGGTFYKAPRLRDVKVLPKFPIEELGLEGRW